MEMGLQRILNCQECDEWVHNCGLLKGSSYVRFTLGISVRSSNYRVKWPTSHPNYEVNHSFRNHENIRFSWVGGSRSLSAKLPQTFWQLVTWNESVSKSIYWIKGVSSRFQILETHVIPRCALGNDLSNRGTTWILRCFRESLRRVHILMNFRRFGNRSSFALCKITRCSPQND